jgi:hypothetical protein
MPAPKGSKNALKVIDWNKIDELLRIGCTELEISIILRVNEDTLTNHCKKEKGMLFSEYIKKGLTDYKIGLRRAQMRSAVGHPKKDEDGNIIGWLQQPSVVMQIWLGKQYLDQKDKTDLTTGGEKILQVPFVFSPPEVKLPPDGK